ncbi:MAG: GNAT family N-acetyltransferase [Gammaproteobacteria bacterium]|nr:GNAT family N-acetyltransferase [Gammaproteobacteria bacterium]
MSVHYFDSLFAPRAVAVFGATERPEAVGEIVLRNLREGGFDGGLYPVNPKHATVQGLRCHASLQEVGAPVDLAVIATPAATAPGIIAQCGAVGVRAAVVLSAGFGEVGAAGRALEQQVREAARMHGVRVVGPNCLGMMIPRHGLNATFSNNRVPPGPLALVSQSGALCTAILDWAQARGIGFSAVVSLGNAADVDFGDLLGFLALDAATRGILLYIESVRDARNFMSGLRAAARLKPVVAIKAGRHGEGAQAAMSHTGALVGGDDVFDAALRRAGAVRAHTVQQMFAAAEILASGERRAHGNRLAIVTNGGGPGVMAADRAVEQDVALARLGEATVQSLDQVLGGRWSRANPVDILGDAKPELYRKAVAGCLADPAVDGVLALLTPQAMTHPSEAAGAVIAAAADSAKPVLACWMGDTQVEPARALFACHRIPHFDTPEEAVEAYSYLAAHHRNQQLLLQVPGPLSYHEAPDIKAARRIVADALAQGREVLTQTEAKALLRAFHVPVVPTVAARDADEALKAAERLGYPVVLKIDAPEISHKTDVGGVRLDIAGAAQLREAFKDLMESVARQRPEAQIRGVTVEPMVRNPNTRELMVGVVSDPVFGPAISCGAGGTLVELLHDRVVALPPLNDFIAAEMIAGARVYTLLQAFRGMKPANLAALVTLLRRVSDLVCELPELRELDINPLVIDDRGVLALDARVRIAPAAPGARPYAHMAIHPYPAGLSCSYQLSDGTDVTLRPIRPEDAHIEREFVRGLSPEARYLRFMQSLQELTPEMLMRFTQIDYDLEMALIAVVSQGGQEREVAVARYVTNPDRRSCEFAIVVADAWRRKGIGHRLMQHLIEIARSRGLDTMEGEVLAQNTEMLALAEALGFSVNGVDGGDGVRRVTLVLR